MNWRDRFSKFMYGRYGADQFSKFLLGLTIALCIISLFVPRRLGSLFSTLILLLIFYTYFRMFSRNIYKRAAENEKYMRILGSWRNKVANEKDLAGQRKYYHFYKCPGCGQRIRIPKGHGKIQIRCPKCNATFIRRSQFFMFGYVVINKPELKFKEFDVYKSFYCGLCYSLRSRYGFVGQFTLSYDMTFLVMLLTSLYEPKVAHSEHKCIRHPLKAQPMSSSIYSDYVADMNILLSYYKAMDDWNDDRSVLKLAFAKLLNTKHPDDSFDYAAKADSISSLLTELGTREKENETNIDVMAGLFGRIMSVLFVPKDDQWAASLSRIGFFLGKFIYILDAYDDLEEDIKKNHYNPFKSICNEQGFDDRIKGMLQMMMAECSKEFEYLPILENAEVLRNILYAGVWTVYYLSLIHI